MVPFRAPSDQAASGLSVLRGKNCNLVKKRNYYGIGGVPLGGRQWMPMDLMDQQGRKRKKKEQENPKRSQGQPQPGAMEKEKKKEKDFFSFFWPWLVRNWILGSPDPNFGCGCLCGQGFGSGASFRIRRIVSRAFSQSVLLHTYLAPIILLLLLDSLNSQTRFLDPIQRIEAQFNTCTYANKANTSHRQLHILTTYHL